MTTLYLLGMFALAFLGIFVWTRRAPAWRVAFVAAFVSLCAFPVAAQTADGSVLETIRPMLLEIISLIIVAVVAWVGKTAKKKWGIDIEARHREALHWALYTGAQLALKQQLTGRAAVELVLRYIQSSVPDSIIDLRATPEVLNDLAKAKLEQVAAERVKEISGEAVDKLAEALKRAGAL